MQLRISIVLTCDIDGCIHMTYGPGQRRAESRASQPRPRPAAAVRATARSSRAVGPGVCDITTTGLSLSATSAAVEKAGAGERSEEGIYRQALAQFNSASEAVRNGEGIVDQRGSQSGLAGTASERARAWLSRSPLRAALCSWNIASIVCCQTSWLRSIRHWCPTNAGLLEECLRQRQGQPRR